MQCESERTERRRQRTKSRLTSFAVALYIIGCCLIGLFYLNFGFWKDGLTQLAGIAMIALASLMLLTFLFIRMRRNVSRTWYHLFRIFAGFQAFILICASLCWIIYYGETYHIFSTTRSISFLGITMQLSVMLIGAYGMKGIAPQR